MQIKTKLGYHFSPTKLAKRLTSTTLLMRILGKAYSYITDAVRNGKKPHGGETDNVCQNCIFIIYSLTQLFHFWKFTLKLHLHNKK